MDYELLPIDVFQAMTKNLQEKFNDFSGRFIFPGYLELRQKIIDLENDYRKKVKEKKTWFFAPLPTEHRLDQIYFLVKLMNNMPEESVDRAKIIQAQLILRGALIHRFLRIEGGYVGPGGLYGLLSANNSALKQAIGELLNISDTNILDEQTIVTCCSAFRDYLRQEGVSEKYSYVIKKKDNFFVNLEFIIDSAKPKAKPTNERLQYLVFIQSCRLVLNRCNEELHAVIERLKPKLKEALKKNSCLDRNQILKNMDTLKLSPYRYKLLEQMILPQEIALSVETLATFQEDILENIEMYCYYALFGTYVLVLEKYKGVVVDDRDTQKLNDALCKTLRFAIGWNIDNQLDNKTKRLSLTSLYQFLLAWKDIPINATAWGGIEFFKKELTTAFEMAQNVPDEICEETFYEERLRPEFSETLVLKL